MRNLGLVLAGLLLGSLACEGPAPVPTKPTWVDDVEPILRDNCFHCHGSLSPDMGQMPTILRWDFYDLDARLKAIRDVTTDYGKAWASAKEHGVALGTYLAFPASSLTRMPPPPAAPLSNRDLQTIKNWIALGSAPNVTPVVFPPRGTRLINKRPTAAWLVRPSTIVVSDDDHEQVLGKVTCGGADEPVLHSGTTKLPTGWQPPCTATLYDGQDVVTVNLR